MVPRGELVCTCRYVAYANVHLGMCYHGWTELSRSTGEFLYWFAHKWSKDFISSIIDDMKVDNDLLLSLMYRAIFFLLGEK